MSARRNCRYTAALNRVRVGSAPRLGEEGALALADEESWAHRWRRWRMHPSVAVMVRLRRGRDA